jgi:predicted Fe-S protein YdhL (DUF1289 family)
MTTCEGCSRQLVPRVEWNRLTPLERKRIGKTHAQSYMAGTCARCYRASGIDELAYTGGWWNDRGVMRPTEVQRGA